MELRTCEYCGMEFSKEHTHCPLCGRPVMPSSGDAMEAPIYSRKKTRGGSRVRPGRFAARTGAREKARPVKPERAEKPEEPKKEKPQRENIYAIPRWMMIVICALLGAGVLAGALFAFYNIGYFDSLIERLRPSSTVMSGQPVGTSGATEAQYTNEEDYHQELTPEQQEAQPVACTGLTLGTDSVTFDEIGQFYNITATRSPENCTDEVLYTSADPRIATVTQQGKIVAVGGGVTEITASCGDFIQTCLITCDFMTPQDETVEQNDPPALSSTDMLFTYPGQQATLLVSNVESDAQITFASSDDSVATVSDGGVITAVSSGTATVTATVHDMKLECTVRCNLDSSAESGTEDTECTISNEDVTMTIVGEYFRLSLKDSNGDRVSGVVWTSSDTSVCTVDADGIVYAVGRGTTTVYTTYGGRSYECIVRCPIS